MVWAVKLERSTGLSTTSSARRGYIGIVKRPLPIILLLLLSVAPLCAQQQLTVTSRLSHAPEPLVPASAYPSYDLYERIMYGMAYRYPDRCRVEEWGELPSGRKILALKISGRAGLSSPRPRVLCTAAMHGDELAGYWLLLRLAEELLSKDPTQLLDDLDIYINPLANPDGAFAAGNTTLAGARRGNANGIDLNRNYPDPDDGRYPDGNVHQPETKIFMSAAAAHDFDLAINLHGGAELFNYPWDTFRSRHPDTDWWRSVSRAFAQTAQRDSPDGNYFKDRGNGVTNGHDWYPIAGSRQDYMNYYHGTREATVEITTAKRFPPQRFSELWQSVSGALLNYLNEARLGVHGTVTDRLTGRPVRAHVTIPGHDGMRSSVYSDAVYGDFYRYLAPGTYRFQVSAVGYQPRIVIVTLPKGQRRNIAVALERDPDFGPARKK